MSEGVRVAGASAIPSGSARILVVAGHPVALFRVDDSFYAVSNVCLHRGGPIGEGTVDGTVVTCPMHGWEYDLRTGANIANPVAHLRTYSVRVEGDDVVILP